MTEADQQQQQLEQEWNCEWVKGGGVGGKKK